MQIPKFPLWICALMLCGGMTLRADDTPAQAAARAALMQQLQGSQGNPIPTPQAPAPTAPAPATPAPAPVPAMAPAAAPLATMPVVDSQTGDNAAQAQARAALAQKMADMGIPMNQTIATVAPVATKNGTVIPQPIPMVAPALPISMSKEEKLQMLLDHYKADQISPEQYHQQRAAILAAP